MSNVNYQTMSDRELKQYLLTHRDDKIAFETYMDRRHRRKTQNILVEAGEIDNLPFPEQVKIVAERLSQRFFNS